MAIYLVNIDFPFLRFDMALVASEDEALFPLPCQIYGLICG